MYNYILCGFILTFVKKDFLIMDYSVLYRMQPFCCISLPAVYYIYKATVRQMEKPYGDIMSE